MQALSKEAEQKLIAAIEKAAEFVNAGMNPSDAIVKSAAAANIPAGQINLMVHAYNTGRTTKQRELGENTVEKSADFQLADAQTVMDALYPKAVKTSAEIVKQQIVSTDYAVSPAGMLARRRAEQEKAAAAQNALPQKTWTPPPRDDKYAAERAYSEKRAAQLAQEELRRRASAAYSKAAASMDELAQYFRVPGNMSFADAVEQVGLRLGDEGVSVLQKVAAVYPHFEKQAATKNEYYGHNRVYDLVESVIQSVNEYVAAQKTATEKNIDAGSKKNVPSFLTGSILHNPADEPLILKEANGLIVIPQPGAGGGGGLGPVMPTPIPTIFIPRQGGGQGSSGGGGQGSSGGGGLTGGGGGPGGPTGGNGGAGQGGGGQGGGGNNNNRNNNNRNDRGGRGGGGNRGGSFTDGLVAPTKAVGESLGEFGVGQTTSTGMLASVLGLDSDPDKIRGRMYQEISTPSHELTLKNLRAKATLHDLMLNDDVISGYDPREVALAFNDIAATAPNVIDAPAVLAAVLRKRLESGQLADFDAKQLIEMDKLKAERDEKMLNAKRIEKELV